MRLYELLKTEAYGIMSYPLPTHGRRHRRSQGCRCAPRAIFTALRGMQTRYIDENFDCPSVRLSDPSVKRVYCDKTEEKSVQIFIPYERPFSLVF